MIQRSWRATDMLSLILRSCGTRRNDGVYPDNTPGYLRWSTIGESGLVVAIFQQNRDLVSVEQNRTVLGVAVLSLIVGSAVFWFRGCISFCPCVSRVT